MKNEKYIEERTNKNGKSYRVHYKNISKTFSEKEYGRKAYRIAINYRNKLLVDDKDIPERYYLSVEDVFNELQDFYLLRSETWRKYNYMFNKYMAAYKDRKITRVKQADIIECLNKMTSVASDNTIERVLTIWRKMFYMSIAKEYTTKDVTFALKPPKTRKITRLKEITQIDKELVTKITSLLETKIKGVYDRKMYPLIIWTLYYTGMRPCECLSLEKKDIADGYIDIYKELGSDRDDRDVVRICKTPQSVRKIPISDELKPILDKAVSMNNHELLFCNKVGNHYNATSLGDKIHKLCEKNGIKFNMYALRHNFSTQLIKNGADPRTHQELMGHKNYTMSVNYARSTEEQKKEALKCL